MISQNNDLITVVVPIYNVSSYIDACILSIVSQSYTNLEIILVNDGSTDGSPQKCKDWAIRDSRIKFINQPNLGLSAARNAGAKASHGKFITFVDPDDVVEREYILDLYDTICAADADISVAYIDRNDCTAPVLPENIPTSSVQSAAMNLLCEGKIPISACCKLYKTDLVLGTPFIEGMVYEDNLFTFQIIGKCQYVAICKRILYHHLIRAGSITQTISVRNFFDLIRAQDLVAEYILEYYTGRYNYRYVCRNLSNWAQTEIFLHESYRKILNKTEYTHIKDRQRILRQNVILGFSKMDKSSISPFSKQMIKFFVIKYIPHLCYPLYRVLQTRREIESWMR